RVRGRGHCRALSQSCVVTVAHCREAPNAPRCSCMLHGIEPNVITNIGISQTRPPAGPRGAREWEAETCAVGENVCRRRRTAPQRSTTVLLPERNTRPSQCHFTAFD